MSPILNRPIGIMRRSDTFLPRIYPSSSTFLYGNVFMIPLLTNFMSIIILGVVFLLVIGSFLTNPIKIINKVPFVGISPNQPH
jgi:hypothetical protein